MSCAGGILLIAKNQALIAGYAGEDRVRGALGRLGAGRNAGSLPYGCGGGTGRRGSDADVFVPELVAESKSQRVEGGLCCRVHGLISHGGKGDAGDGVHDVSLALSPHDGQHSADREQSRVEVECEGLLPVLVGKIVEAACEASPRIVEEEIDSAGRCGGLIPPW